jgi:hypothetical protein
MVPPGLPFLLALPARVLINFLVTDEQSEASRDVVFRPPQHSITTSPAFAVASDQYAKDWSFACALTQGVSHVLSVPLFAEGFAPFPFSSAVPCSSAISTDEMNRTAAQHASATTPTKSLLFVCIEQSGLKKKVGKKEKTKKEKPLYQTCVRGA